MKAAQNDEYYDQPRGWFTRIKDKFGWSEDEEEDDVEYYEDNTDKKRASTVRVHSSRMNYVSVWLSVNSFDNAKQAADGLKDGHQQIVNLEKAAPEIHKRVIDFLSGVIYALDGDFEKVGDRVYLFTPHNYTIGIESGESDKKINYPFNEN